jgi:two-component system sensor histidine kinase SenX3
MKNNNGNLDFSTILASSVHDMKNSLAMLLGSLADISSECKDGSCTIRNDLLRVQHEGNRVNRDLIQLLTLYKIDRSQYHLNIEEVNVHEFLSEIILEFKYLLNERGIEILLQCDENLNGFFDKELVAGVIKTIINNAYQYAKDKILLFAESVDGYTKLSVIDNGDGYPSNMLINEQVEKSSSNFGTGSTGLGLYFSSQVAKMHRNKSQIGFIQISNSDHADSDLKGGCFSIYLP